jgi:flap endonuclease-1
MGITGFNEFFRKRSPRAYHVRPVTDFRNRRVTIDAYRWMYALMSVAKKRVIERTDLALGGLSEVDVRREWIILALNGLTNWLKYQITPVIVFDGPPRPEKMVLREKRQDARNKTEDDVAELTALIKSQDILAVDPTLVDRLRKCLNKTVHISAEDFDLFRNVMKGIGMPCLQAEHDAEQLCAQLCIAGYAAAVYTTDMDTLVHGAPLIITGTSTVAKYDEFGERVTCLDCVRLDHILEDSNMSHGFLVDLCIMSGCDYNTNIRGMRLTKCYKVLIEVGGCLEHLPASIPTECLNYQGCRRIFTYCDPCVDTNLQVNSDAVVNVRDYLALADATSVVDRFVPYLLGAVPAVDGGLDDLISFKYFPPHSLFDAAK